MFNDWMDQYLLPEDKTKPKYEQIAIAITRMYRVAPTSVVSVLNSVISNPTIPVWAYCGATCVFYREVAKEYGYTTRFVDLWYNFEPVHGACGHTVAEVSGGELETPVFIDPMYGYWINDQTGRVGIDRTLVEFNFNRNITCTRTVPYFPAVDSQYEYFNLLNYRDIIYLNYWNAVSFRSLDLENQVVVVNDTERINHAYMLDILTANNPSRQVTFSITID